MIHYHGCPITPRTELYTLAGRFFCNSFADPRDTKVCHEIGQGNMLDNGAFTAWADGLEPDWHAWAYWALPWLDWQNTWAVLPDSIDGGVEANDRLLAQWAPVVSGAPVWHLDEPLGRLIDLAERFDRVCFGSSGVYAVLQTDAWHDRVTKAFNALADQDGRVRVHIHMLRGMALSGSHYPFASVDSTDVARNHNRPQNSAYDMVARWDTMQCAPRWTIVDQLELETA